MPTSRGVCVIRVCVRGHTCVKLRIRRVCLFQFPPTPHLMLVYYALKVLNIPLPELNLSRAPRARFNPPLLPLLFSVVKRSEKHRQVELTKSFWRAEVQREWQRERACGSTGRREVGVVEWEVGDCTTISAQWRPLEGDDFLAANEFSLYFFLPFSFAFLCAFWCKGSSCGCVCGVGGMFKGRRVWAWLGGVG